jgi:type IV pilus assembly protein PilM
LKKEAFGLDISDESLKIIKLKKKQKGFALQSFNKADIGPGIIEKGVIQNEEALAKILVAACRNVQGKKMKTRYVVASLPEERSFLQVIQMPKMEEQDLKRAVFYEAENYIPLPISEVYLDYQIIHPVKNHLDHFDVLIVAVPKKIVNAYVSCLKKAGLTPLAFEVESEAIARALIENEVSAAPVILIDFGKNSTDFIAFAGRSIQFTHSIPISSDQLTQAIAKAFSMDAGKAEQLKAGYDVFHPDPGPNSKKISEAVMPILDELALQIKKNVNFYQDHASHEHLITHEKVPHVFLCGGGANLKGLPEFFSAKLQLPVELKKFWVNVVSDLGIRETDGNAVSFATALGLALRAANSI